MDVHIHQPGAEVFARQVQDLMARLREPGGHGGDPLPLDQKIQRRDGPTGRIDKFRIFQQKSHIDAVPFRIEWLIPGKLFPGEG